MLVKWCKSPSTVGVEDLLQSLPESKDIRTRNQHMLAQYRR
jgi:hypothetical protein